MTPAPTPIRARQSTLDAIARIWEGSRDRILQRVDVLEEAVAALLDGSLGEELRRTAEREAHKLAGSVATFGFPDGSRIAREMEIALGSVGPLGPESVLKLSEQVLALRVELDRSPAAAMPPVDAAERLTGGSRSAAVEPMIWVVGGGDERRKMLGAEAATRSFRTRFFASAAEARGAVAASAPDAVLLDLAPDGVEQGLGLLDELGAGACAFPTLVIGAPEGGEMRLEVARRGGRGPLPQGARPAEVLDTISRLLNPAATLRMSVLAVDDDPAMLALVSGLLEARGLQVEQLSQPVRVWEALEASPPDLLVLDVDMPGANGFELCRALRDDPRWAELPILFLTARSDAESVERLFAAGADDYVAKPVVGPELVTRVVNRLERTRLLRGQAETDVLTGAANRRRAEREMDRFLRLARRHDHTVAFAILDLDHFKQINDRYGHATGDAVLRRVAHLLQGSFRVEDVVARWGGEEFVVGLYDASSADAVRRLHEVLVRLREEDFTGPGGATFSATFSAGVAVFPGDAESIGALYTTADRALYAAKAAGRNRIGTAGVQLPAEPSEHGADVVLVEDDEALAALLLHTLESRGHRVRWLQNGEEAVRLLGNSPSRLRPRVVLLDVDLPGLDGLSVLRQLERDGTLHGTRVIMLTVRATEEETFRALEMGAFDHIAKPFSIPVLMQRLRRALDT